MEDPLVVEELVGSLELDGLTILELEGKPFDDELSSSSLALELLLVDGRLSEAEADQLGSLELKAKELLKEERDSLDKELLPLESNCEADDVASELKVELVEKLDEPKELDSDDELLSNEPEVEDESLLELLLVRELEDAESEEELADEIPDKLNDDEPEDDELEDHELENAFELELALDKLSDESLCDDSELSLLDGNDEEPLDEDELEDELDEELLAHGSQHSSCSHSPRSMSVAL